MNFLITANPGIRPLPKDKKSDLWYSARQWVNDKINDGTIECHYMFIDGGGLAIAAVDSHETLWNILMEYPLYQYNEWKVRALCDWNHVYDNSLSQLQD